MKSIFVYEIKKNHKTVSYVHHSQFLNLACSELFSRRLEERPPEIPSNWTTLQFHYWNQLLQNEKRLLQKSTICFNDIALYYCKAEKASLKNYRVRKYNTQCYTAPSISTDDNCTKYVHEDQHLDRKILFLPYQCKRTSIFVLLCSDNTHVCLDRGDTLQQSCLWFSK